jgi:hypothetical protein
VASPVESLSLHTKRQAARFGPAAGPLALVPLSMQVHHVSQKHHSPVA